MVIEVNRIFICMKSDIEQPLLPYEPRLLDNQKIKKLSALILRPALKSIEIFLLAVRAEIDVELQALRPEKNGKRYPLGQCLEITQAMEKRFMKMQNMYFRGAAADGRAALLKFLRAGGGIRQIWGDLRGEYFQNAFLIGDYYVDVSNDTVNPAKPKVEILPFENSQLSPIQNHHHFARLTQRYWKAHAFPNIILPEYAAHSPVLLVFSDGRVQFQPTSIYMTALTLRDRFTPSENFLADFEMPINLFENLKEILSSAHFQVPIDLSTGKAIARASCQDWRVLLDSKGKEFVGDKLVLSMQSILAANDALKNTRLRLITQE